MKPITNDPRYPKGVNTSTAIIEDFPEFENLPGGKGKTVTTRWYGRNIRVEMIRWTRIATTTPDEVTTYQFVDMVVVRTGAAYNG